jgi:mono/diheme cytochrome c family protein
MKKAVILATAFGLALAAGHAGEEIDAPGLWDQHCAKCHAKDGSANTKIGKKLKIRDYTDAAVQAAFTDEEALAATLEGVTNEAGKETMKGYSDKLSEAEAQALVDYIRTMDD